MPTPRLFVYGTLRAGSRHPMAAYLRAHATHAGRATLRGRLYDMGPYPGAVLSDDAADAVVGDVYELHPETADRVMAELDDYEGMNVEDAAYTRREAEAVLESGEAVKCWVYVYVLPTEHLARIASGDWERRA
jgi:gamma-glutamylcyclotransferase (GGCT)/AIG2-like uncharacterized protein YtfP